MFVLMSCVALAAEPNLRVSVAPIERAAVHRGVRMTLEPSVGEAVIQTWRHRGRDYTLWARVVPGASCPWLHAGIVDGAVLTVDQAFKPQIVTSVACGAGRKMVQTSVALPDGNPAAVVVEQLSGMSVVEARSARADAAQRRAHWAF